MNACCAPERLPDCKACPRLWKSVSIALKVPVLLLLVADADGVALVAEAVAEPAAEAEDGLAALLMLVNSDCNSEAALPEPLLPALPDHELPDDEPP